MDFKKIYPLQTYSVTPRILSFISMIILFIVPIVFLVSENKASIALGLILASIFIVTFVIDITQTVVSISFEKDKFVVEHFFSKKSYLYKEVSNIEFVYGKNKRAGIVHIDVLTFTKRISCGTRKPLELLFEIKAYVLGLKKENYDEIFKSLAEYEQAIVLTIYNLQYK